MRRNTWILAVLVTAVSCWLAFPAFATLGTNTLQGVIKDNLGTPVPGARIKLYLLSGTSQLGEEQEGTTPVDRFTADDNGEYIFKQLEGGEYRLKVEAKGYRDARLDVTIDGTKEHLTYREDVLILSEDGKQPTTTKERKKAKRKVKKGLQDSQAGKPEEAILLFQEALEIDPTYGFAHNCLGIEYGRAGRMKEAESEFRHAMKTDPTDPAAMLNLANLLIGQKQYAETVPVLEQALAVQGIEKKDRFQAHYLRGICYFRIDDTIRAREDLEKAYQLDPQNGSQSLIFLGNIALKDRENKKAADYFKSYLQANPNAGNKAAIEAKIKEIEELGDI